MISQPKHKMNNKKLMKNVNVLCGTKNVIKRRKTETKNYKIKSKVCVRK